MDRLVLPFIYTQERGSEKSADLQKRVELAQLTENESRVVLQFNQNINFDPSANFTLKNEMPHYSAMYSINMLMGMTGGLFGPSAKVYVTHNLKQIPGMHVLNTQRIRVVDELLDIYLEDTLQSPDNFAVAFVLDTMQTIHTYYARAHREAADAPFAHIVLDTGYAFPWPMDPVSSLYLHYPIEIVVADMSFKVTGTGEGMYNVELTSRIASSENKRAVL